MLSDWALNWTLGKSEGYCLLSEMKSADGYPGHLLPSR